MREEFLIAKSALRAHPAGTSGFDPNHELNCPVPRLTLLFFGAAKDVPEAAKMVTAGTACLHCRQASQRPNWTLL
jgi:hypothetical protein